MWWQYVLVFLGSLLMDVTPFPLPPAFTVMVLLQIYFHLDVWTVVAVGVAGSLLGRSILMLYIARVSTFVFSTETNDDVEFLGARMKAGGWKTQVTIVAYSLLPLPTTPLFVAAGMAKMPLRFVIPAFFIGKVSSDAAAVFAGDFAANSAEDLVAHALSWQSIAGLVVAVLMLLALVVVNWRLLLMHGKLQLRFNVFR
jgi:uncharacterized membrane protein YdjX (TVP38/TMEM64 family)